jgi:hypothetical protein
MAEGTETVECAIQAGREHRDDMARWLAVEVLITDELAAQDETLTDRLLALQETIEARLRAKTGAGS